MQGQGLGQELGLAPEGIQRYVTPPPLLKLPVVQVHQPLFLGD